LPVLIPKRQPNAAEALQEGQPPDGAEFRMILQHARQPVTRNLAA